MTKERKQKLLANMTTALVAGALCNSGTQILSDANLVKDAFGKALEILTLVEKSTK
jgi:hypothetical protein